MSLRALHVAALPFPSAQGTQAAIRFMLEALERTGRDHALLTYAHGSGVASFENHHRAPALWRDDSLRSGPSIAKVVNDLGLAFSMARLSPSTLVAHHVEAAALASVGRTPWVFVAHTSLGLELPTYFAPRWAEPTRLLGEQVDARLGRRAGALAAVSPVLVEELAARCQRPAHLLPIPWPVPAPIDPDERIHARRALALPTDAHVVLYAGNLDPYQGVEHLYQAMHRLDAHLLLATESEEPLPPHLSARTTRTRLAEEHQRRRAYAACDVAVVPRHTPGGLPVKLLDALARGCTVVAAPRALAGYRIAPVRCAARDDDAQALAAALAAALALPISAHANLAAQGRAYVAESHGDEVFVNALLATIREAQR